MEITEAQFQRIEHCLPLQRGNISVTNLQLHANESLVQERRFGSGVPGTETGADRSHQAVSLDSTVVKVHPDGTGALKKRRPSHQKIPRWLDHQDSYGCRGCSNSHNLCAFPWGGG
jgi:hypothetical protein